MQMEIDSLNEAVSVLDPTIFRAYDIRGIVSESLTPNTVYLIGQSLASYILEQGETEMVVGFDGRLSSPMLSQALIAGALATGIHVINIGMVPTPLLYFAAYHTLGRSGVMITGSHNPPHYNGLKMVVQGHTLSGDAITHLYKRIKANDFRLGIGTVSEKDITPLYLAAIQERVSLQRPLKIVIDAGNGVTGNIAPTLFRALNCEVIELFCEVDGHFPNHHPDPSDVHNLADLMAAVREHNADIGFAFDGDGDRLGVVAGNGDIIFPDRVLILFAQELLKKNAHEKIIFDVKCTHHLPMIIEQLGGEPIMWKTGHSLIKAKLAETKAALAGEMSGHFFFQEGWFGFDDALYAGVRLLHILASQLLPSETLFATIPNSVNTPELKVLVPDAEKAALMTKLIEQANFEEPHELTTIDGLRVNFADGWGLVRASNTTPCLVLRFEAVDEMTLDHIKALFRAWLWAVDPELELPF